MNIAKVFGAQLRVLRNERSISQEVLAAQCGVDRTFISMLERGVRQPSLKTIFALSDALEISPSELVLRVENTLV